MQAIQQSLNALLTSMPPPPLDKATLDSLVEQTLSKAQSGANPESWKNQWEFVLRNAVFDLAATEGKALKDPKTTYYDQLNDMLDMVLTFTEHDACDQVFPFTVLQDLLEAQTISSCSHIFSWIEARAERLTEGMVPQKGKALVLLRTLNDLLRRLSNTGATTIFTGRILTFLSRVFPLGERSGVNLRGEYGPVWDGPGTKGQEREKASATEKQEGENGEGEKDKDKMDVDVEDEKAKEEQAANAAEKRRKEKEDFYYTFWGLQLPFSRPPLFAEPGTFAAFKEAVSKVLPVIKEATAKDRALMGNKSNGIPTGPSGPLKRKRAAGVPESAAKSEYYFAKYLTSPDLLDLEIADTHFRRQFLFQLLILLHHLLTFTKTAKATWASTRNRSLQIDFTLDTADAQWVQETITRATEELRQTSPNGRAFSETVQVILEREKNWVKWKNELCTPFDREPWREEIEVDGVKRKVGLEEATEGVRKKMRTDPEPWPHRYGSAPLTEIWEMGYRDLWDLQQPFQPGEVKDFVKKIKQEDARIEMRKKQLTKQAERIAAARAKAAAVKDGAAAPGTPAASSVVPNSASATTVTTSASQDSLSPPKPNPSLSAPVPLHPSLPAKPGSTPVPESAAASPARVSTPNPLPPAAPSTPTPAPATPVPAPADPTPIVLPPDAQLARYEENKQRWAWLALRMARDQYWQHFGKIGTGDIIQLQQEIENAKLEREKAAAAEAANAATASPAPPAAEEANSSHVIFALQQTRRYKVISIDNHHNSSPKALERVAKLAREALPADASEQDKDSAEIDGHTADLTKPDQIRAVFAKYGKGGIWGVVHIAAYKAVGESTEIPLTYYENNVAATVYLLQVAGEFDCTRIVYSSSATVYGTPPIIPIPETTRLEAHSPYGKTKVMCETIISDLCAAEPKRWRGLSLRYFNPAGAHPSGDIGEAPIGRPGNLFPLLAAIAVGRQPNDLKVFGNDYPTPDGTCVRDYLHVLDLAKGHLLALDALAPESTAFDDCPTDARYKAYNLGRGQGLSVLQIVEAMRAETGFDFKYEIVGRRRGDVPDLTADPALAEKQLGFKAEKDLKTMCRDLWNWQTKNPKGYDSD
ncbi:UDP-glucose 4-epimerase [Dichomitus squalens]|uniref:UDP-glucose 4-epimerase n=1 Tax=Dichomitus squalens TaxID=114155 RepID=A0A4V2K805_9APHY|nr:UDP-glucose 4-epimerase [Dichomitus squalens]TBU58128.1 UDP-glucose 4-epimerase [Dichomitus squalens]